MIGILDREMFFVDGLRRSVAAAVGARPLGGGSYAVDFEGSSREATAEEIAAAAAYADQQIACPQIITMAQARKALALNEVTPAMVETALSRIPEPQQKLARIDWEYATEIHRSNPLVASLGAMLGLTTEKLNALFRQAATL